MVDFSYFKEFIEHGVISNAIGTNLIATAIILIAISLIPNDSEDVNRSRSQTALWSSAILAITGVLNGGFGIVLLSLIALWAVLEASR